MCFAIHRAARSVVALRPMLRCAAPVGRQKRRLALASWRGVWRLFPNQKCKRGNYNAGHNLIEFFILGDFLHLPADLVGVAAGVNRLFAVDKRRQTFGRDVIQKYGENFFCCPKAAPISC